MLLLGPSLATEAWHLLFLWICVWVLVPMHELGHASAAVLLGGTLHAVSVGPLRLARGEDGRWRALRRTSWMGLWGLVRATFPDRRWRARYLVHVLAGPAMDLAVLGAAVAALSGGGHHGRLAVHFLWVLFVASAISTVSNLVPRIGAGHPNDGRIVERLAPAGDGDGRV